MCNTCKLEVTNHESLSFKWMLNNKIEFMELQYLAAKVYINKYVIHLISIVMSDTIINRLSLHVFFKCEINKKVMYEFR
jgi:hypothetical protein